MLKKYFLFIFGIIFLIGITYFIIADIQGANNPSNSVNDPTVGAADWASPLNSTTEDGVVTSAAAGCKGGGIVDYNISIIKNGVLGGTGLKNTSGWSTLSYSVYGNSTYLWGLNWTSTDINNASFGVAISATGVVIPTVTHYLEDTNFNFNIPAGATINGIKVEIKKDAAAGSGAICPS
jgi:hypothetical protein